MNITERQFGRIESACYALAKLTERNEVGTVLVNTIREILDEIDTIRGDLDGFDQMIAEKTDRKLAEWVGKHFAHNGVSASPAFCATMLAFCGHSMFALANEVDKLSFYALSGGKTEATEADMRKVCTPAVEYDAFAFANALMDSNRELALAILADYKFRRMDPIAVLGNILRVFCDMEQIYA